MCSPFRILTLWLCAGLAGCTHLSPLRENTDVNPRNSVVESDGYKLAFVEFGEQGSYQDPSQLMNAIQLVEKTNRPLVITYGHGWQNKDERGGVEKVSVPGTQLKLAEAI